MPKVTQLHKALMIKNTLTLNEVEVVVDDYVFDLI